MRVLILVAFFISGAIALLYEVVWTRMLGLVMGNTVYAVSTTLAAFMAGLALGSFVFGRIADRLKRPARFYGGLEILIGLYCAALPVFISAADPIYTFVYHEISSSLSVITAMRFFIAGLILLIPASLMGGTLPVLSRFYVSRRERIGWEVGRLYAVNTWGAVFGTMLAGFVLLPSLGVRVSLLSAAAANVALGFVVLAATRSEPEREIPRSSVRETEGKPERSKDGRFLAVALAFALSGLAALVYQVAWTRIISLLIGPSTYAFALMLACFLTGLALGSAVASRYIDRWLAQSVRIMGFLLLCGAVSAVALVPALAGAVPVIREITRQHSQSFSAMYASYFALVAVMLLVPTTILGAVFPTAVRAASPSVREIGTRVGQLYAANTLGAIIGSVICGFLLIPVLGLMRAVAVGAAIHLIAGAILFIRARDKVMAGVCMGLAVVGFLISPQVDHKRLSSGPYKYIYSGERDAERVLENRELLFYKEGVTATVSVTRTGDELALAIDGKVDASLGADMDTQILLAHLPLLMSPDPEDVLVIGLASGVTLGSVERHSDVRSIDCVEISPEVIEACSFFTEYNYDPLSDPRLNLIVHDARNFLKMTDRSYDVIISEPSNPWMSGSSALFTKEFFESCLDRLKEDGIHCQWLQGYAIPNPMLQSVVATFCEVFPHVSLWMPLKGDLILLGSAVPFALDPERMAATMSEEKVSRDLARIDLKRWDELAGMTLGSGPALCAAVSQAPVQTDSRPLLEFALPKTLHRRVELAAMNLNWLSAPLGDPGDLVRDGEDAREQVRDSAESFKEFVRGQVTEWVGDAEAALRHYGNAMKGPAGRRSAASPLYLIMCRLGVEAENQGRKEEAYEIYRGAIALSPDRSEAHYLLGVAFAKEGRLEEAERHLSDAVASAPDRIEPVLGLGDVLSQMGRHEAALEIMQRTVSAAASDPRAWYGAARTYARAGNVMEAREALTKAFGLGGPGLRRRAAADTVFSNAGMIVN